MEFMTVIMVIVGASLLVFDTFKKMKKNTAYRQQQLRNKNSEMTTEQRKAQEEWLKAEREMRRVQAELDAKNAAAQKAGKPVPMTPQQRMQQDLQRQQALVQAKKREVLEKERKTAAQPMKEKGPAPRPAAVTAAPVNTSGSSYAAKRILSVSPLSRKALIDELEAAGFSEADAAYGADSLSADWKEQAVLCAGKNLKDFPCSRKSLIKELLSLGFTQEEAAYGADRCGADWMEQAVRCAKNELKFYRYSFADLTEALESDGFTREEAEYGAKQNGL